MKKYGIRILSGILVFVFFRLTESSHWTDFFSWNIPSTIFLFYTIAVFLIIWETASFAITFFKKKESFQSNRGFFRVFFKAVFSILPFVFLFAYIFVFHLKESCCNYYPDVCMEYPLAEIPKNNFYEFWTYSAQGFVLSLLIISSDTIYLYIDHAVNTAREKELIQKELIAAKFEGLKNQVNPHFLFNSFSVLASLVEKDSQKAIQFITKLSDMYRYILENDEKDLVTMKEELDFLSDYEFLMKMRHQSGIEIENKIELEDMNTLIPPMSLQILVENAVKHNSFSVDDPLRISIYNEGRSFIVVENPKRPKKELIRSTGIGLKNLSKRLTLSIRKGLEITEDSQAFKVKLPINPIAMRKALIIEDEQFSADRMRSLVHKIGGLEVEQILHSVENAKDWLAKNNSPDIIFLDIQLGDGTGFDILDSVDTFPYIIFTTAFDEYTLKAFKYNSIDYLLKPIKQEELEKAIKKFEKVDGANNLDDKFENLKNNLLKTFKTKFLIKTGLKYKSLHIDDIAYFFSTDGTTYVSEKNGDRLMIDLSLDEIELSIDPKCFFRVNRHLIVKENHIESIDSFFNGRLSLELSPAFGEPVIVSRQKVKGFKHWLDS